MKIDKTRVSFDSLIQEAIEAAADNGDEVERLRSELGEVELLVSSLLAALSDDAEDGRILAELSGPLSLWLENRERHRLAVATGLYQD